jgi:hypothetical protein
MISIEAHIEHNQFGDFLTELVKQGARIVGWNTTPAFDYLYVQVFVTTEEV